MQNLLLTHDELVVLSYALDASFQQSGAFVTAEGRSEAWNSVTLKVKRNLRSRLDQEGTP